MAIRRPPTTFSDTISTADIADDAITSAKLDTNLSVAGTLGVTGAFTASGGIANAGTISAGTIGSNVTVADGASPHGWEHIKTIAYSADTATAPSGTTDTKMDNVVSSAYSAYKLIIRWGSATISSDLYFRYLNSGSAVTTSQYYYSAQIISHTGSEGTYWTGGPDNTALIANDVSDGGVGFHAEILLYNCYASSSSFPQVDGHTLTNTSGAFNYPQAMYRQTGYDSGSYYQMTVGHISYNLNQYVTGFMLYFNGSTSVEKDSWWSCYGLKLPTAD